MEYLIRTYTNPGDTVLDFAMGSGTTGVACLNTGRKFVGIENDTDSRKAGNHTATHLNILNLHTIRILFRYPMPFSYNDLDYMDQP